MKADLHVHSTASDGTLRPEELVRLALRADLTHLAIADHDTVDGFAAAQRAAADTAITVIPAVELSTVDASGRDAHILGYFIDTTDRDLRESLSTLRSARIERAREMVRSLRSAGYNVSLEDVERFTGGGAMGRSHIARALVEAGHSTTLAEAFDLHIGRGRPHYVAKAAQSPEQAIRIIHAAGGLAVLAHPGVTDSIDLAPDLAPQGLDGIEAYHADHNESQRAFYRGLSDSLGLLSTGGSDFHGPDAPNPPLGSVEYPEDALRSFLAASEAL